MRTDSYFSFKDFWHQIGEAYLKAVLKTIALLPFVICGAFTLLILLRCFTEQGDFYCNYLLSLDLFRFFYAQTPTLLKAMLFGLPPILLAVLYLEWDKYKKDEASWFTHGKGCEGPPGYTRRLKWVMAASWDIDAHTLVAVEMGECHKRYEGQFSEDALLREIRRKFARSENKPTEDTETSIRWRIVQNNGREVHIHLQRQPIEPVTWVMTTQFYEWAGRRQPPRLAQTHTTEFVLQATNEGQSSAEG